MNTTSAATKLVRHFGGQSATARALGIKQPTVWGWINGAHRVSPAVAIRAERLTAGAVRAADLCPALKGMA